MSIVLFNINDMNAAFVLVANSGEDTQRLLQCYSKCSESGFLCEILKISRFHARPLAQKKTKQQAPSHCFLLVGRGS